MVDGLVAVWSFDGGHCRISGWSSFSVFQLVNNIKRTEILSSCGEVSDGSTDVDRAIDVFDSMAMFRYECVESRLI